LNLYVDMDGVLCDFIGNFKNLFPERKGTWDKENKDEKTEWNLVFSKGVSFWSDMPWMYDGKELWNHIKKYEPTVLSAVSKKHGSNVHSAVKGKKQWLSRNIDHKAARSGIFCRRREKQIYAGKGKILIDDYDKNIKQWRDKGGIGILHKNTDDTIEQLKNIIGNE